jgi:hypothetical protein
MPTFPLSVICIRSAVLLYCMPMLRLSQSKCNIVKYISYLTGVGGKAKIHLFRFTAWLALVTDKMAVGAEERPQLERLPSALLRQNHGLVQQILVAL